MQVSAKEEKDLQTLLEMFALGVGDVEEFQERLQAELAALEVRPDTVLSLAFFKHVQQGSSLCREPPPKGAMGVQCGLLLFLETFPLRMQYSQGAEHHATCCCHWPVKSLTYRPSTAAPQRQALLCSQAAAQPCCIGDLAGSLAFNEEGLNRMCSWPLQLSVACHAGSTRTRAAAAGCERACHPGERAPGGDSDAAPARRHQPHQRPG